MSVGPSVGPPLKVLELDVLAEPREADVLLPARGAEMGHGETDLVGPRNPFHPGERRPDLYGRSTQDLGTRVRPSTCPDELISITQHT